MYHRRTQTYRLEVYLPDLDTTNPHTGPAYAWSEDHLTGSRALRRAIRLARTDLLAEVYRVQDGELLASLAPGEPLWDAYAVAAASWVLRAVLVDLPDLVTTARMGLARRIAPLPAPEATSNLATLPAPNVVRPEVG